MSGAEPGADARIQLLDETGQLIETDRTAEYLPTIQALDEDTLVQFYRDMVTMRAADHAAMNLQRQGQLALWVPSLGQEGGQVGSARALRPQDHVFPSYREHIVAKIRGVDLYDVLRLMRGLTHGGWDPTDPKNGNVHLYTLVLATQTLHATGFAFGQKLDGKTGTGRPDTDEATIVYFGDGATSEGDFNEALVFASSWEAPLLFFLQNNQWAISVPVTVQTTSPLYLRPQGFGIPSVQIDGNDVLAAYATTRGYIDDARAGGGPRFIEAYTYRMAPHTSSDDPTKYRDKNEYAAWEHRDPILRYRAFLHHRGAEEALFTQIESDAADYAADLRARLLAAPTPDPQAMFAHVYSDPHPLVTEEAAWLAEYEASFDEGAAP